MDEDLLLYEEVWAAGHPHAVFRVSPRKLREMTGAEVVGVKPES